MAYCSECGVYYTDDGAICSSCGRNLRQERKPETETTPTANIILPQSAGSTDFVVIDDNEEKSNDSAYFQIDSHLGKGIIKPQKVELATDGVHFKYDTPSHNFVKAEPVREKPREYRVTDSDMEVKTAEDIYIAKEHVEDLIPTIQENVEEVGEVQSPVEPIVSQDKDIPEIITDEDNLLINEHEAIPEPVILDLLTEPSLPEPDLEIHKDTDVIWEAAQTWFKIPLGNVYRVTGRSLIIIGKYNNKLLEVSLAMMTGVTVRQSWLAKLFGVGDLLISIPEFSVPQVIISGITNPNKVKRILEELCNQLTIDN